MISKETVAEIANKHLAESSNFLVEIKCNPSNEIEVIIDSDNRLTIEDCIKLSKTIESELDRDTEDFELSIYSAGIGQPLKIHRQYIKTIGRTISATMKSGTKITGTLTAVDENTITIEHKTLETIEGKKRKVSITKTETLAFIDIKTTIEELTIC